MKESIFSDKKLIKEIIDVLAFYGNPENYFAIGIFPDPPCGDFIKDFSSTYLGRKPGRRARAILEKMRMLGSEKHKG